MPEFKEQIEKLAKLQEIDTEIFDLTSELDSFPVRISEMDAVLETKKTGMEEADDALKSIQVEKNDKDTEMKLKEEQIAKHETDLYQIKNNKEYTALKNEIGSIKADVSLLEEEIIMLIDKIDEAKAKCEEEKKKFEEETKKVEEAKAKIKSEEVDLQARLKELKARREEAVSGITSDVLNQYDRILTGRGRVALSHISGEFCGECNMHLRPQIINDAKLKKNIILCENCSRILYAEED